MTSRLKSSPAVGVAGPTIGRTPNAANGAAAMTPNEEIEAALDEYQARSCAATALHTLVPDGYRRMQVVIARWGSRWPADA